MNLAWSTLLMVNLGEHDITQVKSEIKTKHIKSQSINKSTVKYLQDN